jgi:hypothetical protein
VGPTTRLDAVERGKILPLQGLELRLLVRQASSQSLYRLSYVSSSTYYSIIYVNIILSFYFRYLK